MCYTGRGLVANRVPGKAEQSPVVLSGPGQEADGFGDGGQVQLLLARNWKLNELLHRHLMLI